MGCIVKGSGESKPADVTAPIDRKSRLPPRPTIAADSNGWCRSLCGGEEMGITRQPLAERRNFIVFDVFIIEYEGSTVPKRRDWRGSVKGLLKAELKRREVSYSELARRLSALGINENQRNLSNKISRGTFTAVFFVQCMKAAGCERIDIGSL